MPDDAMSEPPLLTTDAIAAFIAMMRQRSVPLNTRKSYAHDLHLFAQGAPPELLAVTGTDIEGFLTRFSTSATRRRRDSSLRAFYRWLLQHGIIATNPMAAGTVITQEHGKTGPLAPEHVARILHAIPTTQLRDRALFTLLAETGITVGEALGLLVSEVDLTVGAERIRVVGRGQRQRTVLLTSTQESIRLLRHHLQQSQLTSGSVFRGDPHYGGSPLPLEYSVVHYAWQKYCQAAGVQATLRQLRHPPDQGTALPSAKGSHDAQ